MKKTWTTFDGREIKISELEDDHLENIIRDGYRNKDVVAEAKKRGKFKIPKLKTLTADDFSIFLEAISSCKIEGIRSQITDKVVKYYENGEIEKALELFALCASRAEFDKINEKRN